MLFGIQSDVWHHSFVCDHWIWHVLKQQGFLWNGSKSWTNTGNNHRRLKDSFAWWEGRDDKASNKSSVLMPLIIACLTHKSTYLPISMWVILLKSTVLFSNMMQINAYLLNHVIFLSVLQTYELWVLISIYVSKTFFKKKHTSNSSIFS